MLLAIHRVLLPSTLKDGPIVQDSCEHPLLRMLAMPFGMLIAVDRCLEDLDSMMRPSVAGLM